MDFDEAQSDIEALQEEIEHLTRANNRMKSKISAFDLSLDPFKQFAGSDPDDAVRRACKALLIEHNLINLN